jgi:spore coat polysaccharide biosynthesis predicted glycosyltransferase SpsG
LRPEDVVNKRVLISPLNWGMGHVARCIPIIRELLSQKNQVFIACDRAQSEVFQSYFSDSVTMVNHEGYPFVFKGKGRFTWDIIRSLRKLTKRLQLERKEVEAICKANRIDLIIADHRYGFLHENIPSIFLTHQLTLPTRWFESTAQLLHERLIKKFNTIWVLDTKDSAHAGKLSQNSKLNHLEYIGLRSRFSNWKSLEKNIKAVCIVSGPQPYSEIYLKEQIQKYPNCHFIIPPQLLDAISDSKISYNISSNWQETDRIIASAQKIYSRNGYSTLMDIHFLNVEAELTPTPGQMEQVYLATLKKD